MPNAPTNSDEIILLISPDETAPVEGQRGWGEDIHQMAGFLSMVGRLFQQADQQMHSPSVLQPSIQLSEIELSVEIGVRGEVKLVAGGEASGKGAIKLKFTRPGGK
jgi:hypothetical protein